MKPSKLSKRGTHLKASGRLTPLFARLKANGPPPLSPNPHFRPEMAANDRLPPINYVQDPGIECCMCAFCNAWECPTAQVRERAELEAIYDALDYPEEERRY